MTEKIERWRPVVGWEDLYEVSDWGRVQSYTIPGRYVSKQRGRRSAVPRVLSGSAVNKWGHQSVLLSRGPASTSCLVHRLVLEAFVGPCPTPEHEGAHLNGQPWDNRLENLAWATRAENSAHAYEHGTRRRGSLNGRSKLSVEQARSLRERYAAGGVSMRSLGKAFGLSTQGVCNLVNRTTYKDVP